MVRVIAGAGEQPTNTILDGGGHHAEQTQNNCTEKNLAENLHE
jgi:hypothetical protein